MTEKKYLAKIIAKDPNGLQVISACCSNGKVQVDEIKFLKKNKLFLLSIDRLNREKNGNKKLFDAITEKGVVADWREPDVIRVAPVPLYNSYMDVFNFYKILELAL